jgi:Uma2 family endonuclease
MPVDIRLTYEDYCLLPNDGKRYEIIEGELFVSPSPVEAHQRFVTNLAIILGGFVKRQPLGTIYVAPFDVVFSRFDVVEPDLLYVSKERASVVGPANVQGPPDLVVEVLSESTERTDRTTKLKLYARFGVKEYWILDPDACSAEIYRSLEAGLDLAEKLASQDHLTSPLFPGFSLLLRSLEE